MMLLTVMVPMAAGTLTAVDFRPDHLTLLLSLLWANLVQYGAPGGAWCALTYLLTYKMGSLQIRAVFVGFIGLIFLINPSPSAKSIIAWIKTVILFQAGLVALRFALKDFLDRHPDFFR
jgi:hypothetical protein